MATSVQTATASPRVQQPARVRPHREDDVHGGVIDDAGSVSRLLRYSSNVPIPVVGSAGQTVYGIKEIKAAQTVPQKVNAWVDSVGGFAGIFNDISNVGLLTSVGLPLGAGVVAVLSPVYAVTSVVGGFLDGGRDIYNAVRHKSVSEGVVGGVKVGAGVMGAVAAVTGNIPLLVASNLVYFGAVGWQNRESIKNTVHAVVDKVRHRHEEAAHTEQPA